MIDRKITGRKMFEARSFRGRPAPRTFLSIIFLSYSLSEQALRLRRAVESGMQPAMADHATWDRRRSRLAGHFRNDRRGLTNAPPPIHLEDAAVVDVAALRRNYLRKAMLAQIRSSMGNADVGRDRQPLGRAAVLDWAPGTDADAVIPPSDESSSVPSAENAGL